MDAFEVLQTTLGPALRAVEQGNQNRLLIARDQTEQNFRREQLQREQEFRMGEQGREQTFRKSEREAGEQFTKNTEERQRKYKKDDELDAIRDKAIAAGLPIKDAIGMKKEELEAVLPRYEMQEKLRMEKAQTEGQILNKASLLNVQTNDPETGLPRSIDDIAFDNVRAEDSRKAKAAFAASEERIDQSKEAKGYENVVQNYAKALVERQSAIAEGARDMPTISDMSGKGKGQLAKIYALDDKVVKVVRALPMGPALVTRMREGDQNVLDEVVDAVAKLPKSKNDLRSEWQMAAMQFNQKADQYLTQDREYGAEVKAYISQIMKMPQNIQFFDKRLEEMEKAYPALLRENHFDLIDKYKSKFNPFERQTGGGQAQTANPIARGATPLPGQARSGAAQEPFRPAFIVQDYGPSDGKTSAGSASGMVMSPGRIMANASSGGTPPVRIGIGEEPLGPSMAEAPYPVVRNALIARANELMQSQGRTAGQAVMAPLYGGAASALNVQPIHLGGSAFYKTPGSIVAENMNTYGPQFDALPDDVKKSLILNAISQSYQNPTYRNPIFDWQRSPTPTPFE